MELIVISESKLKVTLTPADMETYGLDFDGEDYDTTEGRRAIWRLFADVKERCGFDATGDRVLVQIWQSDDGGCELYVSKMPPAPPVMRTPAGSRYVKSLYVFDALSDMLEVCRELAHHTYSRPSEVWVGDDGRWFLILESRSAGGDGLDELSFIEEYGTRERSPMALTVLAEHARPIAQGDAVARMARLA